MAKLVHFLYVSAAILAVTFASEVTDTEVVDLQPASTFDIGLGLGGLGLGGWGWNRRAFIPKSYGWGDGGGYIPSYIDGGYDHHGHYPEVPLKGYGYGWREPIPVYNYGGLDNGLGWGWPAGGGYGGLGPY